MMYTTMKLGTAQACGPSENGEARHIINPAPKTTRHFDRLGGAQGVKSDGMLVVGDQQKPYGFDQEQYRLINCRFSGWISNQCAPNIEFFQIMRRF